MVCYNRIACTNKNNYHTCSKFHNNEQSEYEPNLATQATGDDLDCITYVAGLAGVHAGRLHARALPTARQTKSNQCAGPLVRDSPAIDLQLLRNQPSS